MRVPAASRLRTYLPAAAAGILAVAGFAALHAASRPYVSAHPASDEPYNLVVEGFRSGHVWLAKEAPGALAAAANPYDFATYRPYLKAPWGLIDLSYYRGHLYAYFGVTPAVILFWPYRILTGSALRQSTAVLLFSVAGYGVAVALGLAAWRRYYPGVGAWAGAAIALLLASATTLPVFLVRPGLYEVSISCAFSLVMLSLAGLWAAWHGGKGRVAAIAAASLAYGLAVGARPSLLFGAVILLFPAAASLWGRIRGRAAGPWVRELLAALLPISAVGAGLAAYNDLRFDDPFQFGHDFQLSGNSVAGAKSFDPRFIWDNFRIYFLEPLRWHGGFPYVWEPVCPPLARGHLPVEFFFGLLTNLPILLAAALVPWVCSGALPERGGGGPLNRGALVPAVLFVLVAATICCYAGATSRYLLDFAPALALLAVLGFLGVMRSDPGPAQARLPLAALRRVGRWAVLAALVYSVAIGWLLALALSSFYRGAEQGLSLVNSGRIEEGARVYEGVCRINPDFRGQAELGIGSALVARGRAAEGTAYLESAVRDDPHLEAAEFNLGRSLMTLGRYGESAAALGRAVELDPYDGEAEADLGVVLARLGRLDEAIGHLKAAVRLDPAQGQARSNLETLEAIARSRGR